MLKHNTSRRRLLKGVAAGTIGTLSFGEVTAQPNSPRRIIGTSSQDAVEEARAQAAEVAHVLDFGPIGQAVAGRFSGRAVRDLRERGDIRYIERDGRKQLFQQSQQTLPWGIDRVDTDIAHENGETGDGVDIAIIDTGIDSNHPDLADNLGEGIAFSKRTECHGPPSQCREPWDDDSGHGTHVAGTADAIDNELGVVGVATEATLHAVKIFLTGGLAFDSDSAAGLMWVADQGYDVANMSYGSSEPSEVEEDAIQYAADNGVLLVAAAGNSGPCTACVGYPAAFEEVIAVGATTRDDTLASFSSTGPEVDLAAPGVDILSTVPGGNYTEFSGTSMASPHVAGAGALLMANGYSRDGAREQLKATAEDIELSPNESGAGLLDVAAALGLDSSDDLSTTAQTAEA